MKNLLILLVAAITFGCDFTPAGPTPITIVNSNQNANTNNASGDDDDAVIPPTTTNNFLNLDPSSIQLRVDRRSPVQVSVSTPGGVTIPAGDITATILDSTIVMFSEVIGDRIFFRGVAVGATTVIVHAAGASASLSVTVVPNS